MRRLIFCQLIVFSLLILPWGILLAQGAGSVSDLVPCDGPDCDFNSLVTLANKVINFLLFYIAVPVATISFLISGVMIATNRAKWKEEGKKVFQDALIGLAIALSAYLIVKAIIFGLAGNTNPGDYLKQKFP